MRTREQVLALTVYRLKRGVVWHFARDRVRPDEPLVTACGQYIDAVHTLQAQPADLIEAHWGQGEPLRTCNGKGCGQPWLTILTGSRPRIGPQAPPDAQ